MLDSDAVFEGNWYGNDTIWRMIADLNQILIYVKKDSISIREALYFKTSVVASDVISRPKECYIFKNRDLRNFYSKCIKILNVKRKN